MESEKCGYRTHAVTIKTIRSPLGKTNQFQKSNRDRFQKSQATKFLDLSIVPKLQLSEKHIIERILRIMSRKNLSLDRKNPKLAKMLHGEDWRIRDRPH